jgi:hypothetical protein
MDGPTFMVERFVWGAPDRLEVAGTFSGLAAGTLGGAVLTVVGEDGARRLPAIGNGDAAPLADGAPWAAEFAWLEAPVAFDRARLELGASLAVELPAPGTATNGDPLAVEVLEEAVEAEPPAPAVAAEAADATGRLRLEAQLLDQAEQLEEARTAAHRAEAALLRAETDLAAEREARAADAERFHEGLAQLRSSAEEAIAKLEPASAERDAARIELAEARSELVAVRGEVEDARGALDAARADAQALVDRLTGRR